jgi:DNA helicase-2/ATP-dependent DNA helicase PcrA
VLDLSKLSPEQRGAVLAPPGPLAIIAGPGSGKTTVLAARIAYQITLGQVMPSAVLALTFTRVAVRTLRTRLQGLLGDQASAIDVVTFHSLGYRIIRQWSEELGLGVTPPIVYSEADAREVLRTAAREAGYDLERQSLAELARRLERHRLARSASRDVEPLAALAEAYESLLRRRQAVDYPAMLALPLQLFATHPRTLRLLQSTYRAILCDEAQDVCASQYELLRQLAARERNLVLVGDPRQTLFGWRGADSRFLREFGHDFPEARVLRLDQNFRSSARIVALANVLGSALGEDQPLWTTNPSGEPAHLYVAADEVDEARFVASQIEHLLAAEAIDHPGDVAILYRTNQQAMELILALRVRGLPYRVRGQRDLLTRREVRDALAYLRLVYQPADVSALARIVNVPPRGLARLAPVIRARSKTLADLPSLVAGFGPRPRAAAEALVEVFHAARGRGAPGSPGKLLDDVLQRSGYRTWLASQSDGPARLSSLAALRRLIDELAAADSSGEPASWLVDLAVDDVEEGGSPGDARRILLATVHQAKGDEAQVVFVVGLEDGLLPHAHALASSEEALGVVAERQVAYVAVTRARARLYLTYCQTRTRGGMAETRRPSRFLRGLPLSRIERAA